MRTMFKIHIFVFFVLLGCTSGQPDKGQVSSALENNTPRVYDVRPISPADMFLMSPKFSSDGKELLATGEKFKGLFLLTMDGRVWRIAGDDISGWQARFECDRIVTFDNSRDPVVLSPPEYKVARGAPLVSEYPNVFQKDDAIILDDGAKEIVISPGNDKFYLPVLSPRKDAVVFEGLNTGIYIYDIGSKKTLHIGRGNHPSWLSDGSGILYDISEDDGVKIISSDIYLALRDGKKFKLTDTRDLKEMMPVASPDMRLVAFESDGQIFIGHLEIFGAR
jgi:hypothetical protein